MLFSGWLMGSVSPFISQLSTENERSRPFERGIHSGAEAEVRSDGEREAEIANSVKLSLAQSVFTLLAVGG